MSETKQETLLRNLVPTLKKVLPLYNPSYDFGDKGSRTTYLTKPQHGVSGLLMSLPGFNTILGMGDIFTITTFVRDEVKAVYPGMNTEGKVILFYNNIILGTTGKLSVPDITYDIESKFNANAFYSDGLPYLGILIITSGDPVDLHKVKPVGKFVTDVSAYVAMCKRKTFVAQRVDEEPVLNEKKSVYAVAQDTSEAVVDNTAPAEVQQEAPTSADYRDGVIAKLQATKKYLEVLEDALERGAHTSSNKFINTVRGEINRIEIAHLKIGIDIRKL